MTFRRMRTAKRCIGYWKAVDTEEDYREEVVCIHKCISISSEKYGDILGNGVPILR